MVLLPNMYLSPILPVVPPTLETSAKYRPVFDAPPVADNVERPFGYFIYARGKSASTHVGMLQHEQTCSI